MAIIKPIETPNGAVGTYHRIHKVEMSADTQRIDYTLAIYLDESSYRLKKLPLTYSTVGIQFSELTKDPREVLYPILQQHWTSYLKDGISSVEVEDGVPLEVKQEYRTIPLSMPVAVPLPPPVVPPPQFKQNPY